MRRQNPNVEMKREEKKLVERRHTDSKWPTRENHSCVNLTHKVSCLIYSLCSKCKETQKTNERRREIKTQMLEYAICDGG